MQDHVNADQTELKRVPWNKGKLIGAKPPLRPKKNGAACQIRVDRTDSWACAKRLVQTRSFCRSRIFAFTGVPIGRSGISHAEKIPKYWWLVV